MGLHRYMTLFLVVIISFTVAQVTAASSASTSPGPSPSTSESSPPMPILLPLPPISFPMPPMTRPFPFPFPFPFPLPSPPMSTPPESSPPMQLPFPFPPLSSSPEPSSQSPESSPPVTVPFPFPPIVLPPSPVPPVNSPNGIKSAYWPSWSAYSLPPLAIPPYFTHVFYAFVEVDATNYELLITQPDDQWMGNFTATLHAQNMKALLSIGGANAGPYIFANVASTKGSRAAFVKSTITVARKYGFDGLDIDYEFPQTDEDMSNLASLLKHWRTSIENEASVTGKPQLLLSAAVYFASNFTLSNPSLQYPMAAIHKYMDFVNPMCFDLHGPWNTSATGGPALLYDSTSNISTSYGIDSWIKNGVPAEKLIVGLPMYGHSWQLKDKNIHGIGAPAVGAGPGSGTMVYKEIVDYNAENNATVVYDEKTVSTYSYSGTSWIGYDDEKSIKAKVEYAHDLGLAGYFFWVLGDDKNWTLSIQASKAWDNKSSILL